APTPSPAAPATAPLGSASATASAVTPAASPLSQSTADRLAERLPTFYAGLLLDPSWMITAPALRAMVERGLPARARAELGARDVGVSAEARVLAARGYLALGQTYWRALDFDRAAQLAAPEPRGDEARFYLALALALRGGPEGAAQMMRHPPDGNLG